MEGLYFSNKIALIKLVRLSTKNVGLVESKFIVEDYMAKRSIEREDTVNFEYFISYHVVELLKLAKLFDERKVIVHEGVLYTPADPDKVVIQGDTVYIRAE